jgi:hypothetical protein
MYREIANALATTVRAGQGDEAGTPCAARAAHEAQNPSRRKHTWWVLHDINRIGGHRYTLGIRSSTEHLRALRMTLLKDTSAYLRFAHQALQGVQQLKRGIKGIEEIALLQETEDVETLQLLKKNTNCCEMLLLVLGVREDRRAQQMM